MCCVCSYMSVCLFSWRKYVNVFICLGFCVRVCLCLKPRMCQRFSCLVSFSEKCGGAPLILLQTFFKGALLKWWLPRWRPSCSLHRRRQHHHCCSRRRHNTTAPCCQSVPHSPARLSQQPSSSLPSHHPPHCHHGNCVHTHIHTVGYRG